MDETVYVVVWKEGLGHVESEPFAGRTEADAFADGVRAAGLDPMVEQRG